MNLEFLNSPEFVFFKTRDYALTNGLQISAATEQLKRYEAKGLITKLTRGVWANNKHPYFSPIAAVPYLLNNEQGYVSFLTAMNRHGIISQIPQSIQIASTGRPRKLNTPIANYEFIQLTPSMFLGGIDWTTSQLSYLIASSEKALLDTLYISTRRGKRFSSLPELDFSSGFKKKAFLNLLNACVTDKRINSAISRKFQDLWELWGL